MALFSIQSVPVRAFRNGRAEREASGQGRIPLHIGMKKKFRLKSRLDFQSVYTRGRSSANRAAVVHVLKGKAGTSSRVGFAAGRKLGKAVIRNRLKRRLRAAVQALWPRVRPGLLVVVIARQATLDMPFAELQAKIEELFERSGVLVQEGKKS